MPADMEPMEGGAPAPEQQPQGNEAQVLIAGVGQGMAEVAKALPQIGGSEDDQAEMAELMDRYQSLMSRIMSGEGEQRAEGLPQVPVEAGPRGVPMQ